MNLYKKLLFLGILILSIKSVGFSYTNGPSDILIYEDISAIGDTIPVQDNYGDFLTDPNNNPFDITPSNVEQTVEYDPETNEYVIYEKIGEEYYKTPTALTFSEYLEWQAKNQESQYFQQLAGIGDSYKSKSGILDPISKVDIKDDIVDRLFGGSGVTIKPQGNIDLTILPYQFTYNENPNIFVDQQFQPIYLDFNPVIQMTVDGGIGDKMKLGFNYNTQSTFDFDQKIKLDYDSANFNEDDIIKKVEAGDVSLPLRSSLITGAQKLFGLKTELQFGNLRLTAIASEQRSKQDNLQIQNGAQVQKYELRPDEYDENRHFFLSHYHRDNYEQTLSNLPYLNTAFRINRIQVWVSNDRPEFQENSTMITAISDLAEGDPALFASTNMAVEPVNPFPSVYLDRNGGRLPDNRVNDLYEGDGMLNEGISLDELARRTETSPTQLTGQYGLKQGPDFATFRGRLLSPSEYSFNKELGFISLNIRLKPEQVLGVSYDYYYTFNCDTLYTVGELSEENTISDVDEEGEVQSESVLFVKMLKPENQSPLHPSWDLMMKNVYALRTNQLNPDDFTFDIFFEDDMLDGSLKKFLPLEGAKDLPLLNMFNLDRLNNYNDPQPDGIFDFVPGVTVIPRNGSIIFPLLEPFGDGLDTLVALGVSQEKVDELKFDGLYDTAITMAREQLEKNKFVMMGEYKSSVSSEISLGSWNLPQGSIRVRAGSQLLIEGSDYEVDYGAGRVRILNETYLQQGVPLDISFEDSSVFSFQQKTMLGLRADYALSKHANIGATFLRLKERPFTQKVNIGDDPIQNKIYGLDFDYSKEAPWLTKAIDKLPFYSTNQESNILFTAEVAALRPGHSKVINIPNETKGVVNIDDFEGAVSGLPLGTQTNRWSLSSVPTTLDYSISGQVLEESTLSNDIRINSNRALLNWFVADRGERTGEDDVHSYTRRIDQDELFDRDLPPGQFPDIYTFDLVYYPEERGPYNFDVPDGGYENISQGLSYDQVERKIKLAAPETRWGGITRYMVNSDFQATNYEFIDFWMLNPYMERVDGSDHELDEEGKLIFHLGSVSEDVIADANQFYENALPAEGETANFNETNMGVVPIDIPVNNGFAQEDIEAQDLGFDGLNDDGERLKFEDWINLLEPDAQVLAFNDPSNDNFLFYGDPELEGSNLQIKYKQFNNPQGNAPRGTGRTRGNPIPDAEDLNNNKSLNTTESYFEYGVDIFHNGNGEIDVDRSEYITESKVVINPSNQVNERWYRVRIPLNEGRVIGGIDGFRSIQFLRLLTTGFKTQKTLRMAEFELVRNQWRKLPTECRDDAGDQIDFSVDVVGVEENTSKQPFNYIKPAGIVQEQLFSTFANVLQDEKSLSMNFCQLADSCEISMYKLTELDLRFFENLQLFVHAEEELGQNNMVDGDLALFVRLGKDFKNNYYEYEIPLVLSKDTGASNYTEEEVWVRENMMDLNLKLLTELKKLRNVSNTPATERFTAAITAIDSDLPEGHKIYIKGNPTLGFIKDIQIGVRNVSNDVIGESFCGEVWVNELRAAGFKEKGGVAGLARLDVQMADLGNLTFSGNYSSIGYGGLDQNLQERSLDEIIEYDVATNLQLGKLLPSKWNVSVPFYAQYAQSITNPLYDAYALDLTLDETAELDPANRDEILARSQDVTTIKTINFTNVRKEKGSKGGGAGKSSSNPGDMRANSRGGKSNSSPPTPPGGKAKKKVSMPWDISNFSVSYAYTETNHRDPFLLSDDSKDYRASLDYIYANKFKGFKPFEKLIKTNSLKPIKELNFNPVPSSFSFSTNVNRFISERTFRLPDTPIFQFDDRLFDWRRRYTLKWNLMKTLKLNFNAENVSVIDELRQRGIAADPSQRDWVNEKGFSTEVKDDQQVKDYWMNNLRSGGRNTNYSHQLSLNYTLPTKNFRILDWINVKGVYKSDYSWVAGPLIVIDDIYGIEPGAVIQNSQDRSINGTFSFDKLYKKSKYLKRLESGKKAKVDRRRTTSREETASKDSDKEKDGKEKGRDKKEKKIRDITTIEKVLVRPLLLVRTVKVNYKERLSTLVPGFQESPDLLGLSQKWSAPGWKFVTGLQPNLDYADATSFLRNATDNNWINPSPEFNQQIMQEERQNFDATINLEPWKYFKIDIDFSKKYNKSHTQEFKNKEDPTNPDFQQFALNDIGSFEVSYLNFNTLFDQDVDGLFKKFLLDRSVISSRLDAQVPLNGTTYIVNGVPYQEGFRQTSTEVMIPSFLATYAGDDINNVPLDLESTVRKYAYFPAPNWKVRYDGLTKIPRFKEIFSSFTLDHSYKSSMSISQFRTDPLYNAPTAGDPLAPFQLQNPKTNNYYSRLDIPSIRITEQFAPLIGVNIKTKSDFLFDFEYRKSRDLDLTAGINGATLMEVRSTGLEFGVGYTFKNVELFGKKKATRSRNTNNNSIGNLLDKLNTEKKDEKEEEEEEDGKKRGKRGVTNNKGNDLVFNFDLSLRDDVTYLHEETSEKAEPVRGTKTFTLQPSVEYEVNKNLSLRAFVSYRQTDPRASNQYQNKNFQTGITLRFKLE